MNNISKIVLPTLRGAMGDWNYYVTIMPFKEVAQRVSMADEIHKNQGLSTWIQREVLPRRTKLIVSYLREQKQRFFNALILGIYGGQPSWQELDISLGVEEEKISEEDLNYLNKTFGILILNGDEKIFAIDGQHRTKAIREALHNSNDLSDEEITVIFVAHREDEEGRVRTRRLFSTLNRYAKPVSMAEIIALDEEDNCAIITRKLVDEFDLLDGKILIHKNRSISRRNTDAFTNIIVLYDLVTILLTNKPILNIRVKGEDKHEFTTTRASEEKINLYFNHLKVLFQDIVDEISCLENFFEWGEVDRENHETSLLFRPIGQNIFFSILKVAIEYSFKDEVLEYFAQETFNLDNPIWKKVFWDEEGSTIRTDKILQRLAIILILKHLEFKFELRKKDQEVFDNYQISPEEI